MTRGWLVGVVLGLLSSPAAVVADSYLLVVSGVGGDESYSEAFHSWSRAVIEAAENDGLAPENITFLAEDPAADPDHVDGESTKENVEATFSGLAGSTGSEDQLWIVLFGHGSARGGQSRFNLVGPDMTAEDFGTQISRLQLKSVVFVNGSSASAGFIEVLSAADRAVITATRSDRERHAPIFGEFFSAAFSNGQADVDKDDRVSLLEAFNFARIEVDRRYRDTGRLPTEHALLDDDGDGEGTLEPSLTSGDGSLASRLFLVRAATASATASPEVAALLAEKESLEDQIAALRSQKESLSEELYLTELETLLVALARKNEEIRNLEASEP